LTPFGRLAAATAIFTPPPGERGWGEVVPLRFLLIRAIRVSAFFIFAFLPISAFSFQHFSF
jgi:hypothetical protein